ncbi:MAG: hypothetical protein NTU77_00845, partial [Actinobacteria bacterium]|nr:hypothetical protein [Actinomycetota bacterium]
MIASAWLWVIVPFATSDAKAAVFACSQVTPATCFSTSTAALNAACCAAVIVPAVTRAEIPPERPLAPGAACAVPANDTTMARAAATDPTATRVFFI